MIDLKTLKSALEQLEEERGITKEKIIRAIEDALTAAYKKDYGKKGQIIRAEFDLNSGAVKFLQVKIVVDESMVRPADAPEEEEFEEVPPEDRKPRFNEEHHIWLNDAQKIKRDVSISDELVFPLEAKEEYGRIAAQTAKQVIIQKIREAEREAILGEYAGRSDTVVSGKVQKIERGDIFVDLGRTTAILPREEQIPREHYRHGERIRAYLYQVEETPRGVNIRLSRSHPNFLRKLFEMEVPEVAHKAVEIKAIAREAGSRSKVAVASSDDNIDPVGSCVGQKGSRVGTITNELGGEKIDIIEWSDDPKEFIGNALSPATIEALELNDAEKVARVKVPTDQFSLAVGRGGQNVRLAVKLTGWKIDIQAPEEPSPPKETVEEAEQGKAEEDGDKAINNQ